MIILRWKVLLTLLFCFTATIFSLPSLLNDNQLKALPSWMYHDRVNLGLDLQGGSQLLLEVDVMAGLKDRMAFTLEGVRKTLRAERIGYLDLGLTDKGDQVSFRLRNIADGDKVAALIKKLDSDVDVKVQNDQVTVAFTESSVAARKKSIVDQSIEIVRRRIDEVGTKEPNIQRQGDSRILIQLPGLADPGRIKTLLGKTAKMSFRMVDENKPIASGPDDVAPVGTEILVGDDSRTEGKPTYYVVRKEVLLGGENLVDAGVGFDEYHRPHVTFRFDTLGARKFGDVTLKNIGKLFAIVLDGKVISAPKIQSAITGGAGIITGQFTLEDATDLALLMRAGALVAPLTVLEERTVGPDLGADSIASGQKATILSVLFVAVFMVLGYTLFGLFANIAMFFNLLMTVAVLSLMGATLTLPGIAGVALTMGMAVDANVLINERIKEELRNGRKILSAIDVGYRTAFGTILDSHLTTLIGALALFFFGTGPIKGFGVTLAVGLLISLFTAVLITRVLVSYWIKWFKPQKLPI